MLRSTANKVMWVGRATVFMVGLAVILALVLGVATTALGATGGNFLLGKFNAAETPTSLVGTLADAAKSALVVQNKSGGAALDLRVGNATTPANDVAPMKVNSSKKVAKLNADRVDDREASSFANGVGGVATNAENLDGKDSTEFVQNTGEMTFSVFDSWRSSPMPSNPATVEYEGTHTRFTRGAGAQTHNEVELVPPLPTSLYGKNMLLTGVQVCYNTSNTAVSLSRVRLKGSGQFVFEDSTPADGDQCQMYRGTPQLLWTNTFANLLLDVNWSQTTSESSFFITRTTFFLEPSNTAAAPCCGAAVAP